MPEKSLLASLRTAFFAGLLLVAPLGATLFVFSWLLRAIGDTFRPFFFFFLPTRLLANPALEVLWNILATILVILLTTALGFASRYVFGKYFGAIAERAVQKIPGVGAVYSSIKQIVGTFGTQNRNLFSKVVLVEFPHKGIRTIGFITTVARGEIQAKLSDDMASVFVPTTPNPTSGFLLVVPKQELIELEMSVGDGMKMIISGGTVVPPWPIVMAAPPTLIR